LQFSIEPTPWHAETCSTLGTVSERSVEPKAMAVAPFHTKPNRSVILASSSQKKVSGAQEPGILVPSGVARQPSHWNAPSVYALMSMPTAFPPQTLRLLSRSAHRAGRLGCAVASIE